MMLLSKENFKPDLYIASNARLIESIGYDLEAATKHYIEIGSQNNWPIELFDPSSYIKKYKDISNSFGNNLVKATKHYIVNGYRENRFWVNDLLIVEGVLQREPEHKGARKEKFLINWQKFKNAQINTKIKSNNSKIGIGIITYNRLEHLKGCVKNIKKYTQSPYYLLIADDGSDDGTVEWCRSEGLVVISGYNRGVCWNKNRALYALKEYTDADCIILLEDDCWPEIKGWELNWSATTHIWHHVNYAAPWILKHYPNSIYMDGIKDNPACPYLFTLITGQCTTSSRHALNCVGYLDSRFKGYGYGHVEWSQRFRKCPILHNSLPTMAVEEIHPAIDSGLSTQKSISYSNDSNKQENAKILLSLKNESIYRFPWQNDEEKSSFLNEVITVRQLLLQQVSKVNSAIWDLSKDGVAQC